MSSNSLGGVDLSAGTFQQLRSCLGLSCESLAAELGVSVRSVYRWENASISSSTRLILTFLGLAVRIGDECVTEALIDLLGGSTHWCSEDPRLIMSVQRRHALNAWLRDSTLPNVIVFDNEKYIKHRVVVGERAYVFAATESLPDHVVVGLWIRSMAA